MSSLIKTKRRNKMRDSLLENLGMFVHFDNNKVEVIKKILNAEARIYGFASYNDANQAERKEILMNVLDLLVGSLVQRNKRKNNEKGITSL